MAGPRTPDEPRRSNDPRTATLPSSRGELERGLRRGAGEIHARERTGAVPRNPQRSIVEIDARGTAEPNLDPRGAARATPAGQASRPPADPRPKGSAASPSRSFSAHASATLTTASRPPRDFARGAIEISDTSAREAARIARPIAPAARRASCAVDGRAVELDPGELSAAGLFVRTPEPLPAGSEVRVLLRVDGLQFEAAGHVIDCLSAEQATKRKRAPGYALLFMHVDEPSRAQLRAALEQGAPPAERVSHPGGAPRIDPSERHVLAKLQAELAELRSQTPWAILGLPQGADRESARQAFFAASKRYHPHLFARYALPEIKQTVTELFIAYKRAFTSMTKPSNSGRPVARSPVPGKPNNG